MTAVATVWFILDGLAHLFGLPDARYELTTSLSDLFYRDGVLDETEFRTLLKSVFHPHNLSEIPEEKLEEFMKYLDMNKVSSSMNRKENLTIDYVFYTKLHVAVGGLLTKQNHNTKLW